MKYHKLFWFLMITSGIALVAVFAHAGEPIRLPGDDPTTQMTSAGALVHFIDTGLFRWAARILAGICIFSAGWHLKEMQFGPAIISIVAAILFGTAPTWVRNIFEVGGADSVFSYRATNEDRPHV